jgi:hypothetical protein
LIRENGVRDKARHGDGARFFHALSAVYQGTARLNLQSGCQARASRAGGRRGLVARTRSSTSTT